MKSLASVFEPWFSKRDHRSADLIETEYLYNRVKRLHEASRYAKEDEDYHDDFRYHILLRFVERIPASLRADFCEPLYDLVALEKAIVALPDFNPSMTLK